MPADFLSRTVTAKDEKAADLEDDSVLVFTLGSIRERDTPVTPSVRRPPAGGRRSPAITRLHPATLTKLLAAPQLRNMLDTDFTTPPAWHSAHATLSLVQIILCSPRLSRTPRDFIHTTDRVWGEASIALRDPQNGYHNESDGQLKPTMTDALPASKAIIEMVS